MAKSKIKTHKATAKRIRITGNGKLKRDKRQQRNSRFSRTTNRKSSNTDTKNIPLAKVEVKRIKKLLNI